MVLMTIDGQFNYLLFVFHLTLFLDMCCVGSSLMNGTAANSCYSSRGLSWWTDVASGVGRHLCVSDYFTH